jgi:hypothetical protein
MVLAGLVARTAKTPACAGDVSVGVNIRHGQTKGGEDADVLDAFDRACGALRLRGARCTGR